MSAPQMPNWAARALAWYTTAMLGFSLFLI